MNTGWYRGKEQEKSDGWIIDGDDFSDHRGNFTDSGTGAHNCDRAKLSQKGEGAEGEDLERVPIDKGRGTYEKKEQSASYSANYCSNPHHINPCRENTRKARFSILNFIGKYRTSWDSFWGLSVSGMRGIIFINNA